MSSILQHITVRHYEVKINFFLFLLEEMYQGCLEMFTFFLFPNVIKCFRVKHSTYVRNKTSEKKRHLIQNVLVFSQLLVPIMEKQEHEEGQALVHMPNRSWECKCMGEIHVLSCFHWKKKKNVRFSKTWTMFKSSVAISKNLN